MDKEARPKKRLNIKNKTTDGGHNTKNRGTWPPLIA